MLALLGVLFLMMGRLPLLGRLPGDILFSKGSFSIYVPLATMVLVSLVLTVVANVLARLLR